MKPNFSLAGIGISGQDLEECCFSRAVGTQTGQQVPFCNREITGVELKAFRETFAQCFALYQIETLPFLVFPLALSPVKAPFLGAHSIIGNQRKQCQREPTCINCGADE